MVIKIRSAQNSDGWFVFGNAEDVFFSRHTKTRAFFDDSMVGGTVAYNTLIAPEYLEGRTVGSFFTLLGQSLNDSDPGWHMTFCQRGGRTFELWGDTEAYLLNDSGKTLERIF